MSSKEKPHRPGWYWFLPDPSMESPTRLLRLDKPITVLVGLYSHDSKQLVVRFSAENIMRVEDMPGMWEESKPPKFMLAESKRRIDAKNKRFADAYRPEGTN